MMKKNEEEQPHLPEQKTLVAPAELKEEVEEEELTNNEIERKRCYQNLLTELALEIRIEITWMIVNGYQNEPTNSSNTEKELEFEDSSDDGYKDTGYSYYNPHLGSNHCWWNTNEDKELFSEFTANLESSKWLPEFDDYINWNYNNL
ncbi:25921_t:CDS:2 [Dentiscutata erythropus]|uniref:25921_t:CDS:1 n=1 Tax=Dentiscutata erythropus TaxID=1348616 RepID=A0A9N9EZF7_9GLOM|nr:25921_t:CDS:2 [Dentiscutata erythropus]